ncbi:uncharacterized protein B0I36DRAFT_282579 [Microdochium trichocladiopsis]|uniref:Uncharacterized protein n=1 Tax=Microdochium trichocladiopsis TaxID=1682393 RepID=A0A9P9C0X8_9PEZI|nr:uncharacterized protein B0I36DRAFT_282579 [Microdochium trichocladiopsis]KAH7041564.1 hypothetical protein B0I36DRAFT_282579 [Microdochium trichocladiopsis]
MFLTRCLLLLSALVAFAVSQDVGFSLDGIITSATATDSSYNTGGFITTNGWRVIVPKNLQVGFPAAWVSWKDFVAAYSAGQFHDFEVSVTGNVVPQLGAVAGQIYISQLFLQGSQGIISQVNNDGTIKIANGPTIRINDPNAVYSVGYTGSPFMTADDENPSISSFGGFPMCVPRSPTDPLCPASNRPGNKQGIFTALDPLAMAPFVPGDFVEYSGYTNGAGEIVCFEITALNVQISTGGAFSFIRVEDAIIGVFSGDGNAESARSRFIGYTSETAGSPVSVHAIEVDPCTGAETLRQVAGDFIRQGDVRNKFVLDNPASATDTYTREYVVKTASGSKLTTNNIKAGYYIQPVTEWIQPELAVPGAAPVAFEFAKMKHLTQGLGPDEAGNIWGPLSPFPQSGVTTFDISTCPKIVPSPSSTAPADTATTAAGAAATPTKDTVKVLAASWTSSGSGSLQVACTSSNTTTTLGFMLLDYTFPPGGGQSAVNQKMTPSPTIPGQWTITVPRIKQPSSVVCKTLAGGNATAPVTKGKRRSAKLY